MDRPAQESGSCHKPVRRHERQREILATIRINQAVLDYSGPGSRKGTKILLGACPHDDFSGLSGCFTLDKAL